MRKSAAKSSSLRHSPCVHGPKMARRPKPKTSRTLEEWIALTKKDGPMELVPRRVWLKFRYNLRSNSAWWISERADGTRHRRLY
jgi:hypothetical protein